MKIPFDESLACYCFFESIDYKNVPLKIVFNRLLHSKYHIEGVFSGVIFFNNVDYRKDHANLFSCIYKTCQSDKNTITIKRVKEKSLSAITSLIQNLNHIKKIQNIRKSVIGEENGKFGEKLRATQVLNIYLRTLFYYNLFSYLKKIDFSRVEAVVTLADVIPEQHVLTLYANKIGKKTITCQHALFPSDLSVFEIHILNSYKIPSSVVLTWGDYTNGLMEKYSPGTVCITCGNPAIKETIPSIDKHTIGIVLDIPTRINSNKKMISVVKNFAFTRGLQVKVRMHPSDKIDNYAEYEQEIFVDDIYDCMFVVGHGSTMILNLIAQGIKTLRFSEGDSFFELPRTIEFHDVVSLEKKVSELEKIDFQKISAKYIECIGDVSFKKYSSFFNEIVCGKETKL